MRLTNEPLVVRLAAGAGALALWLMWALLWPGTAAAADSCPPGLTCATACGAAGTGYRVGTTAPVTLAAPDAAGLEVGPDGYWRHCVLVPTPDTTCGAEGVGMTPTSGLMRRQSPGWRVDAAGRWVECDRPCPTEPGRVKSWRVGDHVCVGGVDHGLAHRSTGYWQQWAGAMRGQIIERCDDGARRVTGASCAPAQTCDTRVSIARAGRAYVYDARPTDRQVPLGGYATSVADDGATLRLRCQAGDLVPAPQCQAQEYRRGYTQGLRVYRYAGPPLDPGQRVTLQEDGGARQMTLQCQPDGTLRPAGSAGTIAPYTSRQGDARTGAASWPGR